MLCTAWGNLNGWWVTPWPCWGRCCPYYGDYINIKEIVQLWHYCIMWLKYQIWDEYHHSLLEQHPVGELAELLRRHRLLALPRWPLVHFWTVGSQIAPPSALVRFALLLPLLQPHYFFGSLVFDSVMDHGVVDDFFHRGDESCCGNWFQLVLWSVMRW